MKKKILILTLLVAGITASFATKAQNVGTNIGDKAPDIIEKTIDGKEIKLSSLKGQVVLIDFWASWCGPCRRENPTVVEAYKNYKDEKFESAKGFTVFSVSLDKSPEAWEKAIDDDELTWEYHVSDLKGWHSKYATVYGVRSIPSNYLVNGEGIIVAKNLRGPALEAALKKMLK